MEDGHFEGLSSLVRLSGANVPSRARFVGEALLSSTLGSITLGLVCGQVGAIFMTSTGPLVPFLVGSWTGYTFGLYNFWSGCKKLAISYAQQYPTLLAHAIATERFTKVPPKVLKEDKLADWILQGGLGRLSMSILAAQSCRSDNSGLSPFFIVVNDG